MADPTALQRMRRRGDRPGRCGPYWLSRRPNSPHWCRTWYDRASEQTKRVSLGEPDFEAAHDALIDWFIKMHAADMRERAAKLVDYYIERSESGWVYPTAQETAETIRALPLTAPQDSDAKR